VRELPTNEGALHPIVEGETGEKRGQAHDNGERHRSPAKHLLGSCPAGLLFAFAQRGLQKLTRQLAANELLRQLARLDQLA
jgi:hypothetical protein